MLSVWLHGWATDSRVFAPLTASLATPCLAPNLEEWLGGRRPEHWPEALAAQLEKAVRPGEPLVLAGWSLGAMLALEATPLLGECLAGLILLSGCARFIREDTNPDGQDPRALHLMRRRLPGSSARVLGEFYDSLFPAEQAEHRGRLRSELEPGWLAQNPVWLDSGLEYLLQTDLRPRLDGIQVPVRLVHGAADRVIAVELGRELAGALPAARFVELEQAGHLPFWPRCGRLAEDLGGFIDGIERDWKQDG